MARARTDAADLAAYRGNLDFTATLAASYPKGTSPTDAIRRKCVDCVAGEIGLISRCEQRSCALWPYRMGRNPFHGFKGEL